MLKDAYVRFETAQLLQEKGFQEPSFKYYTDEGILMESLYYNYNYRTEKIDAHEYTCPTHQMVLAWLRKNNIFVEIDIYGKSSIRYEYNILNRDNGEIYSNDKMYKVYEVCVENAILFCLKKLL